MGDADTSEERNPTGGTIELSPLEFVYLHDNDSLNGAGEGDSLNRGKNTNVFSPKTVRSTAMGYARGLDPETTGMISCPSSPDSGTPPTWLKCCLAAIQHLKGDKEVAMGEIIRTACNELLKSPKDITWAQALRATLWSHDKYGLPNEEFVKDMPTLITIQGQNRAAVMITTLHGEAGVPRSRAGGNSHIELFEGEGAVARQGQLKAGLMGTKEKVRPYIYDFMSYEDAEKAGNKTHIRETESRTFCPTQLPGLYTAVERTRDVILQLAFPTVPRCHARMRGIFGPGWLKTLAPGGAPGKAANRDAVATQKLVMEAVTKDLSGPQEGEGSGGTVGFVRERFKGTSFLTLVYASALTPEVPIIRLAMERLRSEDESQLPETQSAGGRDEKGDGSKEERCSKPDFSGKTTPECLAQLFGLYGPTQQCPELCDMIRRYGLGNKVKSFAVGLAREDLLRWLCESLGRREWSGEPERLLEMGGVVAVLDKLVTEEDAVMFTRNAGEMMNKLLVDAGEWFSWLCQSNVLSKEAKKSMTSINKRALQKEYGRMEARDTNLSNKSNLSPGIGQVPRLSTSSARVEFSPTVLGEWLSFEEKGGGKKGDPSKGPSQGKRARVLALEFACLLVERSLSKTNTFKVLWDSLSGDGVLKTTLLKDPSAFVLAGCNFFNESRLATMRNGGGATQEGCAKAGSSRVREKVDVEMRSANGEISVFGLTPCQMQEIGLLRADGSVGVEEVTVTFRNLSRGDDQRGEPSDGAGTAASKEFLSDNDDDESQSPRDAEGSARGVKRKAEVNYEDGGSDFSKESEEEQDLVMGMQPVSKHRFDQGEEAEKAMAVITRVVNEGKDTFGRKEGGKVSEGVVSKFFKDRLPKGLYRNLDLAASTLHAASGHPTVYVTMPGLLSHFKGRKPNVEDLSDREKAKFLFYPGNEKGSLVDLVVGQHNTSFPSNYVCVRATGPGDVGTPTDVRKDRTPARGGSSRV